MSCATHELASTNQILRSMLPPQRGILNLGMRGWAGTNSLERLPDGCRRVPVVNFCTTAATTSISKVKFVQGLSRQLWHRSSWHFGRAWGVRVSEGRSVWSDIVVCKIKGLRV